MAVFLVVFISATPFYMQEWQNLEISTMTRAGDHHYDNNDIFGRGHLAQV